MKIDQSPIISISNGSEGFVVYTEVSKKDLDYILMKDWKVIVYTSKQLKNYE